MDLSQWIKKCDNLSRKTIGVNDLGERTYLQANFADSAQKGDIEKNAYTIGDFYRTKNNLKMGPSASDAEWHEAVVSNSGFDMPAWASTRLGLPLKDCNMTFVAQTKTCNLYCPWCFVDDQNKNGKKENGAYFSTRQICDAFEEARNTSLDAINVLRRSGGEPLLLPWQWTETLEELDKRGLTNNVYFQGETNLTTGSFIESLQQQERLDQHFWNKIAEYNNFGVLCSFKGTDEQSNLKAIGIKNKSNLFLEEERWKTFRTMVEVGIDCYPFIYDPNPDTLPVFLEKGVKMFGEDFVSKTWVFPLKLYEPVKNRLDARGINFEKFQQELDKNFQRSLEIMQELVPKYTGHEYKAVPRTGIVLKSNA